MDDLDSGAHAAVDHSAVAAHLVFECFDFGEQGGGVVEQDEVGGVQDLARDGLPAVGVR
ncbi:hypothetical protein ACIQBJ_06735 [Kitasatospora sp. NPDC088391]|uniref:hypothetical protein n=1 Tax=Kitasatospora sp. NPDC088391 TaxID=3364074 RepID=UPI00381002DD